MSITSLSSSLAAAIAPAPKAAAPADAPHDGDGDDAAKIQATPAAGTGARLDVSA